ncbi:MAG: glycoside hydrolase family 11 protein [Myxococcales bacterium]
MRARTTALQIFMSSIALAGLGCSIDPEDSPTEEGGSAGAPSTSGAATGVSGNSGVAGHNVGGVPGGTTTGGANAGASTMFGGNSSGGMPPGGNPNGGSAGNGTGGRRGFGGSGTGGRGGGGSSSGGSSGNGGASNTGGGTGSGGALNCSGAPLSGGTQHCSSNAQGNVGSYSWTIWSSGSGGCVTPYGVGAAFKATWNNSGDFLARVGLGLGSNKTYDQFGTFSADFAETKSGSAGGYSYIGIYGWSVSPLIEYYIVDDWFSNRPNPGGSKVGTLTVDGGTYDIYKHQQVNQPAITGGNQTFDQFFSVRQTARSCGHISISEHFKQWASLGLKLGNMEEARILIEAGGGNGSIDFTTGTLTVQ